MYDKDLLNNRTSMWLYAVKSHSKFKSHNEKVLQNTNLRIKSHNERKKIGFITKSPKFIT